LKIEYLMNIARAALPARRLTGRRRRRLLSVMRCLF
jgi:hypothetical protein